MNLTHKDILDLIENCKGHVKSLKIGKTNIEIEFLEPHQPENKSPSTHHQGHPQTEIPDDKNVIRNLSPAIPSERLDEEDIIDTLAISHPALMEDLIAMKEVERVKEEND